MQAALRMTTTVHADGKVEFIVPQAAQEETLEIIVLFPEHRLAAARPKRSVMDILNDAPGNRLFRTAADVDAYLEEERNAWGN